MIEPSIFKAYDIRGFYPKELNERGIFYIAHAIAEHLQPKQFVVGQDARISSSRLKPELLRGLLAEGVRVIDIGPCTTPQFYFAVSFFNADGGAMLTASHNPAPVNGLKIVGPRAVPIGQNSGLAKICELSLKLASSQKPPRSRAKTLGLVKRLDAISPYLRFLAGNLANADLAKLKSVVVDASNGMCGLLLPSLLRNLQVVYEPLNLEPNFEQPAHSLDPLAAKATEQTARQVVARKAAFGAIFDGDGDRLILVDEQGQLVSAERILWLLARQAGSSAGGRAVLYTANLSRALAPALAALGFEPVETRVGHALVKKAMLEHNALLAGELSGHFFFNFTINGQVCYFESALYALTRILVLLAASGQSLSSLAAGLKLPVNSGQLNFELADKQATLAKIKAAFGAGKLSELDGLSFSFADWWFNLRSSNTENLVRLVVEADNFQLLAEKTAQLRSLIAG